MKFTITSAKPRNPLAIAARARRAGSHRLSRGGVRQLHATALRRELDQLDRRKDSP
jgi:hypothetical protein